MSVTACASWVREPRLGEIRNPVAPRPSVDEVLLRTRNSAMTRGTGTLVFRGAVPVDQADEMSAPSQEGSLPGPLKHEYLSLREVESAPAILVGRTVVYLHPHQTRYVSAASAVVVVADDVPPERAVLADTVGTVVNAAWTAAPLVGDRGVGDRMVGLRVTRLILVIARVDVTDVDVLPDRASVVDGLGVRFARPDDAPAYGLVVTEALALRSTPPGRAQVRRAGLGDSTATAQSLPYVLAGVAA